MINTELRTFPGGQEQKDELIAQLENSKTCDIGSILHPSNHYEKYLGIPVQLGYIKDSIFQLLAKSYDGDKFLIQFINAIEPHADLTLVWPKLAIWLLTDITYGVETYQRLVQLCPPDISHPMYVKLVDDIKLLGETTRGDGGFGSTGR